MNKHFFLICILSIFIFLACSSKEDDLFATITTEKGTIKLRLFYKQTPLTVSNFVGLAEGIFSQENPNISREGNFYDGLIFHRVIADFVIQGGDPEGTGRGGPGYSFQDEFHPDLIHDQEGILSMANSGPGTNGSQFFITLAPTPHLNNKHSVFGITVSGMEIVKSIERNDEIKTIRIEATGKESRNFLRKVSWQAFQDMEHTIEEDMISDAVSQIEAESPPLSKTEDGIYILELEPGTGEPVGGQKKVLTHYELRLYGSEKIIDSSYSRDKALEFQTGSNQVISGWDIIVKTMRKGQKLRAVIPPELGYGKRGAGQAIPPNSFLDFIIELVDIVED